jgi:hypothetical protein
VKRSVLHVESKDTDTLAVLHQQVEREVLDEEVGVVSERLAVEGMQNGVSSSIGGRSTSVRLSTFTVLQRLTTESPLVDLSLLGSRERDTEVFELDRLVSFCTRSKMPNSPR